MKLVSLQDQHFSHSKNGYSCDFHPGRNIQWCRKYPYTSPITVFTGNSLHLVQQYPNRVNVAWLIEPYEICPMTYEIVRKNYNFFDLVLTHDLELLDSIPNSAFMPYGDCWIKEEDWKIYPKSKLCSIFCSEKKMTKQHILRHQCLTLDGIDKFGYMNRIDYKLDGLKDYKFSIVVENSNRNDWFTEKLLDCFATGTVPIYCGTRKITKFFDCMGMLSFDTFEEIDKIIKGINNNIVTYEHFVNGVNNNFQLFQKFVRKDDTVLEILEQKGLVK